MKFISALSILTTVSMAQATVSKTVACRITRDNGLKRQVSIVTKKLILDQEGGVSRATLLNDSAFMLEAYSSDYKPDAGSRLFLQVNDIVVPAERGPNFNAKMVFSKTGDAEYTYDCTFN